MTKARRRARLCSWEAERDRPASWKRGPRGTPDPQHHRLEDELLVLLGRGVERRLDLLQALARGETVPAFDVKIIPRAQDGDGDADPFLELVVRSDDEMRPWFCHGLSPSLSLWRYRIQ